MRSCLACSSLHMRDLVLRPADMTVHQISTMSITSKVLLAMGASGPLRNQRQTDQLRGPDHGDTLVLPLGELRDRRMGNHKIATLGVWRAELTGAPGA
jgi:hypothetical protein